MKTAKSLCAGAAMISIEVVLALACAAQDWAPAHHGSKRNPGQAAWSTYMGGAEVERITAAVADEAGNVFVTGYTAGDGNIADPASHQPFRAGEWDAFLVKFDAAGKRIWGTYFGGDKMDLAYGLAISPSGEVLISGGTESARGMTTAGAQQTRLAGWMDAFVACFDADGRLRWSTYYGGSEFDVANGIAAGPDGSIAVFGSTSSPSGIATPGALQTAFGGGTTPTRGDAFLALFSSSGALRWCTYFGGTANELARATAIDDSGRIFISGYASSSSGIASHDGYQTAHGGLQDAFLGALSMEGDLLWSTYLGGPADEGADALALLEDGAVAISGWTESTSGISSTGAHQEVIGGGSDGFLAVFESGGALRWSTYYGGADYDGCNGLASFGSRITVCGGSVSDAGIATADAPRAMRAGGEDAFAAVFESGGARLSGAYFGGEANDEALAAAFLPAGIPVIAGWTSSGTGIAGAGSHQPVFGGGVSDGFIATPFAGNSAAVRDDGRYEQPSGFNIEIHPNPARDRITLRAPSSIDPPAEIVATDMLGSITFLRTVANSAPAGGYFQADISSLAPGLYTISFPDKAFIARATILIMR